MFKYQGWKFDTIESIPFDEENFEIIKVTNLRNVESDNYDFTITEPAFMTPANAAFWHFVQEGLSQYEVISSKINYVKLFFYDYNLAATEEKKLKIEDYCKIKHKHFAYIKDLANIYSYDKYIYMVNNSSIIIKEAYFINDIGRLMDRETVLKGDLIPYWIQATDSNADWIDDGTRKKAVPYCGEEYIEDKWQMTGLSLVKERLRPYFNEDINAHKKIYISREDVNKMWSELAPTRAFANENILIDYFVSQGYNKVVLTEYDYIDQINIIFNATHIAGITGSGLFNAFICKPGTVLIEIHVSGNYYWSYQYFKEFGLNVKSAELRWRKDYTAVLSNKNMNKLKELVESND